MPQSVVPAESRSLFIRAARPVVNRLYPTHATPSPKTHQGIGGMKRRARTRRRKIDSEAWMEFLRWMKQRNVERREAEKPAESPAERRVG